MEEWLINKQKEDLLVYCKPGYEWANNTLNKHSWTLHYYVPICTMLEVEKFSLSENNILPFVRIMGKAIRLKYSSISVCNQSKK